MHFKIQKNLLDKTLEIVSKYTDPINAYYALRCVLIKVTDEKIYLIASNGTQSIQKELEVDEKYIEIYEEGIFLIQAQIFKNSIKKLSGLIDIKLVNNTNLEITEGFTNYSLTTIDIETFLPIDFEYTGKTIEISSEQFKKGIKDVEKVVSSDMQIIYKCINLKIEDNKMIFGATDTYRLAYETFWLKNKNQEIENFDFSLENNYFKDLLPSDVPSSFQLYYDNLKIGIIYKNTKIISRFVDMEFYNLTKVIPTNFKYKITINKAELMNLIDKVAVVTNEKQNRIEVKITNKEFELKTFVKEIGTSIAKTNKFKLDEGSSLEFDLNFVFLKDAINVFEGDITLNIDEKISKILILSEKDPNLIQLITPKRR